MSVCVLERMAVGRLVLVAVAVALVSLVLNVVAALGSGWTLQELDGGRKRSVGLWKMCMHDTDTHTQSQAPVTSPPCQTLGWGADLAGKMESHNTVKRECVCVCINSINQTHDHDIPYPKTQSSSGV